MTHPPADMPAVAGPVPPGWVLRAVPPPPARAGDPTDAVDTPALLVDLDALERNLARVHGVLAAAGKRLRVHGKAHRTPALAALQVARGAIGVCCQKVSEAEAFAAAGIADLLVTNEVVGASKLARLARLALRVPRLGVCVDAPEAVDALAEALREAGARIDVLIELDVGQGRCGVTTEAAALALAERIAQAAPALRLRGLQAYHGRAQHVREPEARRALVEASGALAARVRDALRAAGHGCQEITGGGTGTYVADATSPVFTECQAGSYALMDADYARNAPWPGASLEHALTLSATVLSTRPGQVVLDAGLKAFAVDSGLPVLQWPGWSIRGLSDEHAVAGQDDPAAPGPALGARVRCVPSHVDPTVNLHDWVVAHRDGRVVEVWPVAARGAGF